MPARLFTQDQLEAIAGALGDTDEGLTGTEIGFLLRSVRIADPGEATKRVRLFNAFAGSQAAKGNRTHVLELTPLATHDQAQSIKTGATLGP